MHTAFSQKVINNVHRTLVCSSLFRVPGLGLLELAKTLRKIQISETTGLMLKDTIVSGVACFRTLRLLQISCNNKFTWQYQRL